MTKAFAERLPGIELSDPREWVNFQNMAFSAPVSFIRFYFPTTADADFHHAKFSEVASFDNATFSKTANFNDAGFSGPLKFVRTKFSGCAVFTDASFDAPCNFREAKFKVAYPDLEGTLLHAKTNITVKPKLWPPTRKQKPDPDGNTNHKPTKRLRKAAPICGRTWRRKGCPRRRISFFAAR